MIQQVEGDILLSKAKLIVQGVAPQDHFNQGLALALRERWPAMAKDFRHYCHERHPKSGTIWVWAGPNQMIANLLTQEAAEGSAGHPGKADLSYVRKSLESLREFIQKEKIESVAVPRLATGVGGLEWKDVFPIIEEKLGDLKVSVYVYATYHAGQQGKEV
ncbi:MAG: macro domain-containing protein [Deltaproteobacteria bacterium]|nr:MAG: macro domain-containing protein [Deltaproteobacteria bacterium]